MPRKAYSEQEREQVRTALLTTVIQCIADQGLIHSSIDILCKKVGISKTFFYTFFASKEDLVLEALRYQQPRLLYYAQQLMDDPSISWQDGVRTFLETCAYGEKKGIAVLSIEEEQEVYRCLSRENFQTFRDDQTKLFRDLLVIFWAPRKQHRSPAVWEPGIVHDDGLQGHSKHHSLSVSGGGGGYGGISNQRSARRNAQSERRYPEMISKTYQARSGVLSYSS